MQLLLLANLVAGVAATGPVPVTRSGLAGIAGFTFYSPYCGHGCFRSFSPFTLTCSDTISAGGHTTADELAHALALCRAGNLPFLRSIAWCMHLYCPDSVLPSLRETFWETEITGDIAVRPRWSYGAVLANITTPPTETLVPTATNAGTVLNTTVLTTYDNWQATWVTLYYFFRETSLESYYGLALCLTAVGLPLALTWLGYLPYATGVLDRAKPWLLYPSLVGTYHDRPLPWALGNAPTRGQGLYVGVLVVLNVVFLAVGYRTAWPRQTEQWYADRYQELMAYFMWRTGVLAFCQMPVLVLFSTRNNLLLWLTNWSHATYLLLHRWVARLFLVQTLLHSLLALVLYQHTGAYAASLVTGWWIWGCVATVAAVLLVLGSVLVFRQRAYELFLATHVVLAVLCVVGCWYHVYIGYENTFGYETWLYATIAVWFADRLARVARVLKTGLRRAVVTEVGPTLVRVDIPGVRWAAAATATRSRPFPRPCWPGGRAGRTAGAATSTDGPAPRPAMRKRASSPLLLCLSVRAGDRALVEGTLHHVLAGLDDADKDVRVGQRLDPAALLADEAARGWATVGVVACGPAGLCDAVRAEVARLGRAYAGRCAFELQVDSFSY
ncbi:ferric reductase-like transmembrane component [Niveomyces insectorum RCEF 264]|uniref:Ferric reductase-like transmembrane component n=1 Tax=Niveomyces insectorum RCEF 264 TaxID=1081102 RepID=A0A167RYJ4_9HYPO|nr:ferric reductase-like transmembrane component [Niveomyces insectorum RCEF 264]